MNSALIVEDLPEIRASLGEMVRAAFPEIRVASAARRDEALDLIGRQGFDPALQVGAFGYLLKEQAQETLVAQLLRMSQGEPPLSPPIARRVLGHFAGAGQRYGPTVTESSI